jgi:hypothetical protein
VALAAALRLDRDADDLLRLFERVVQRARTWP